MTGDETNNTQEWRQHKFCQPEKGKCVSNSQEPVVSNKHPKMPCLAHRPNDCTCPQESGASKDKTNKKCTKMDHFGIPICECGKYSLNGPVASKAGEGSLAPCPFCGNSLEEVPPLFSPAPGYKLRERGEKIYRCVKIGCPDFNSIRLISQYLDAWAHIQIASLQSQLDAEKVKNAELEIELEDEQESLNEATEYALKSNQKIADLEKINSDRQEKLALSAKLCQENADIMTKLTGEYVAKVQELRKRNDTLRALVNEYDCTIFQLEKKLKTAEGALAAKEAVIWQL